MRVCVGVCITKGKQKVLNFTPRTRMQHQLTCSFIQNTILIKIDYLL